jgi:hypothetical protein
VHEPVLDGVLEPRHRRNNYAREPGAQEALEDGVVCHELRQCVPAFPSVSPVVRIEHVSNVVPVERLLHELDDRSIVADLVEVGEGGIIARPVLRTSQPFRAPAEVLFIQEPGDDLLLELH